MKHFRGRSGAMLGWLGLLWSLRPVGAAVTATEQKANGETEILLENDWLRLRFTPARGGNCRELLYKPTGRNLTTARGMLIDRLWQQSPPGEFCTARYAYALRQEADAVHLRLTTRGQAAAFRDLQIEKTVTLPADRPLLEVTYRLTNVGAEQPVEFGLWAFHVLGLGEGTTYYYPTTEGIQQRTFGRSRSRQTSGLDHWAHNPARGWTALVGPDGTGLVVTMEFDSLQCLYWCPLEPPQVSVEWRSEAMQLAPGQSFATRMAFLPFHGLTSVAGAGAGLVGRLEADRDRYVPGETAHVALRLASAARQTVALEARARRLPEGREQTFAAKEVEVSPDAPQVVTFDLSIPEAGTQAVRVVARRGDETLADFHAAVHAGEKQEAMVIVAPPKRASGRQLPPHVRHLERANRPTELLETPHFDWAEPYAARPLRAVFLVPAETPRDAIELAQRLSLEWTLIPHGLDEEGQLPEFVVRDLMEALDAGPEVLLAAAFPFDLLPAAAQERLVERVQEGLGFVGVQVTRPGPLQQIFTALAAELPKFQREALHSSAKRSIPARSAPFQREALHSRRSLRDWPSADQPRLFCRGAARRCRREGSDRAASCGSRIPPPCGRPVSCRKASPTLPGWATGNRTLRCWPRPPSGPRGGRRM